MLTRGTKRKATQGAESPSKKPKRTAIVVNDEGTQDPDNIDARHETLQRATRKVPEIVLTNLDETEDSDDDDGKTEGQKTEDSDDEDVKSEDRETKEPGTLNLWEAERIPPDSPLTTAHIAIGPKLFEMARRATELVVDATEEQLARVPAPRRAVIRARMPADFTQFMYKAVGEFANQLE